MTAGALRRPRTSESVRTGASAPRRRVLEGVASWFPLNRLRVAALRLAGYRVGEDVYIGGGLQVTDELDRAPGVTIGDRVSIAQRVILVVSSHPNRSRVRDLIGVRDAPIVIEDDAWLGAGAIVLPGVRIGAMSVVGAGSVVTRDVPPATVVAGNPARTLRHLG